MADTVWFWIAAGGMTLAVAATMVAAVLRARPDPADGPRALQVYRDQLAELERDAARGLVPDAEADRLRTEIARRLLDADRARGAAPVAPTPRAARAAAVAAILAVVGAGSVALYARLGAPGYPDIPLAARIAEADARAAARIGQEEAEARLAALPRTPGPADPRHVELVEQLREVVAGRPDDLRGHELLARNEAMLGNFAAARRAQAAVVALKGDAATAEDHAALAELMILAASGFVSPEAEAALNRALALDPANGTAHYYMGLLFAQNGRFDLAVRIWRPLLDRSAPDAPWVVPILDQMPDVAALAGVNWSPPVRMARGPSAADVAAASSMDPEARQAMIRGMVEGLAARLASDGGPPEDWAQLIRALGVLGEGDRAAAIWAEAQGRFAAAPAALDTIRAAAVAAGVAE